MNRPDDKTPDLSAYDAAVKADKLDKGWDVTTREAVCILAAAATFIVAVVAGVVVLAMWMFRWFA